MKIPKIFWITTGLFFLSMLLVDDMGIFAGMIAFGWMMNIENTYHGERETE